MANSRQNIYGSLGSWGGGHRLWSQGARGACVPPLFGPREANWGASFELQPLVCSGKVITLTQHTQQCITQVTKLTTNSQQDPLILGLVT